MQCGARNDDMARFCIKCGASLPAQEVLAGKIKAKSAEVEEAPATRDAIEEVAEVAEAPLLAEGGSLEAIPSPMMAEVERAEPRVGTRVGMIGALVVLVCFFLPWVRSCGGDQSGLDLATSPYVEGNLLFFLTPLTALLVLGLLGWANNRGLFVRMQAGRISLVLTAPGLVPVLDLFFMAYTRAEGLLQPLYGLWATLVSQLMMLAGAVVDMQAAVAVPAPSTLICPRCGAENPASNRYCLECGRRLVVGPREVVALRGWHLAISIIVGLGALFFVLAGLGAVADPQATGLGLYAENIATEFFLLAFFLGLCIALSFTLYRRTR